MTPKRLSRRTVDELVAAESRVAERHVDRVVADFIKSWGKHGLPEQSPPPADAAKPLILVVDCYPELLDLYRTFLEHKGFRVSTTLSARIMLVKARLLKPSMIVSGLNVLHGYPPAYWWMLTNLAKRDGIPVLFATAAYTARIQREIPFSMRARVLKKPFHFRDLERDTQKLLAL